MDFYMLEDAILRACNAMGLFEWSLLPFFSLEYSLCISARLNLWSVPNAGTLCFRCASCLVAALYVLPSLRWSGSSSSLGTLPLAGMDVLVVMCIGGGVTQGVTALQISTRWRRLSIKAVLLEMTTKQWDT